MRACALTVAGSDSGGGAGVQADLKTFQDFAVHGACVITSVTAQNTQSVMQAFDLPAEAVEAQLKAVFADFKISAVKTGMLSNPEITAVVSQILKRHKIQNVVVDPVMTSKSGYTLLDKKALRVLITKLLPLACLVTPNFHEAEILSGTRIDSPEKLKQAAKIIGEFGPAVLVKGGHSPFHKGEDLFWDGREFRFFRGKPVTEKTPHGTGCVHSASIAAGLALKKNLPDAVRAAKSYIQKKIEKSARLGRGCEIL